MTAALRLEPAAPEPEVIHLPALVDVLVRHARVVATAGLLASVAAVGWGVLLWAGQRFAPPPVSFVTGPMPIVTHFFMALAYSLVGAVLAIRKPRNPIGWLFIGIGLMSSVIPAIDFLVAATGRQYVAPSALTVFLAWLASSFHLPLVGALVIVVFLIFPGGRVLPGRWHLAVPIAIGGAVLVGVGLALDPTGLRWYPTLPNPTAMPPGARFVALVIQAAGLAGILVSLSIATAAMVVRFRGYSASQRRALALVAASVLGLTVSGALLLIVRFAVGVPTSTAEAILVATLVTAGLVPVSAAIGMLRHHLFDTDLILNHALVYVPLTGFLAGLYAASVALFQRVFMALTGDTSDVAIVITTLVLAGTFSPLRKALEGFVDRHFKPAESDAAADVAAVAPADADRSPAALPVDGAPAVTPVATGEMAGDAVADDLAREVVELRGRLARLEHALVSRAESRS